MGSILSDFVWESLAPKFACPPLFPLNFSSSSLKRKNRTTTTMTSAFWTTVKLILTLAVFGGIAYAVMMVLQAVQAGVEYVPFLRVHARAPC